MSSNTNYGPNIWSTHINTLSYNTSFGSFDLTGNITNAFASRLNLFPTHAWGKNLKNISFKT